MHWQPPTVDLSALGGDQLAAQNSRAQANKTKAGQISATTQSLTNSDSGYPRWRCKRPRSYPAAAR